MRCVLLCAAYVARPREESTGAAQRYFGVEVSPNASFASMETSVWGLQPGAAGEPLLFILYALGDTDDALDVALDEVYD